MSLIQVSDLTFAYDGSYENIFDHVSFQLDTNWRLGFTGRNGRGKTTFLNLLLGKYEYQGSISASVTFSYFPYPVADESSFAIDVVEEIYPEYQYWQLQREMAGLQLEEEVLYRPYETLSNGEQTKLQLAVLFLKENNFLLIDEPTNHLDIRGRNWSAGICVGRRALFWCPMTGPFWMAAWTISCPSTKQISKSSGAIFPAGTKTSSGRMPLSRRRIPG